MQYAQYPYKKGKFGHREMQREGNVGKWGEKAHLQAKESVMEQILPCQPSEGTKHVKNFELQKSETISFHFLSHLAYSILLQQYANAETL